jgi:uncharacterized RDD family membrane protein YckC
MKNIFTAHYYDSSKLMHSNQLEGLELADFTRRFFALLIDLIVLVIFLYVIGTVLDYFGLINFGLKIGISSDKATAGMPHISNDTQIDVPEYVKVIFKLSIPVLYFGLITWWTNGYTIGKLIFRIRIVSTNHKHLTLWHSIERSLGYYASSLEFGFGFLQYFIDYNRRTVHDRIAETIVIKVKKSVKTNEVTPPVKPQNYPKAVNNDKIDS